MQQCHVFLNCCHVEKMTPVSTYAPCVNVCSLQRQLKLCQCMLHVSMYAPYRQSCQCMLHASAIVTMYAPYKDSCVNVCSMHKQSQKGYIHRRHRIQWSLDSTRPSTPVHSWLQHNSMIQLLGGRPELSSFSRAYSVLFFVTPSPLPKSYF